MIQQKTALEKQRRAGIVALALQGKQGGHGVERTVDDPGCFLKSRLYNRPGQNASLFLRRLFRGKRKGTGWLSLHPIRTFQFNKSDPTMWDHLAEREGFEPSVPLGHTRFPVVRLRPAQPSFHNGFCCVHSTRKCLIIISGRSKKVKHFLEKNGEIFRRVDGQPKV